MTPAASVAGVDLIVSWNFKHIVHYDKINGYHAVNLVQGDSPTPIHTPRKVASDEEEERRRTEQAIASDPILGHIWKNVRRVHTPQRR